MVILTNNDILAGHQPLDGTCIEGKVNTLSGTAQLDGNHVLITIKGDEPGIVMNPLLFDGVNAPETEGLLKKHWHGLFKPDVDPALSSLRDSFFPDESEHDFQAQRRIFGMGSFVFLKLDDGLFAVMVQRQAPKNESTGAVNIGKYSRAAGSADGDLIDRQTWELGEELYALIDRGTHFENMVFVPRPLNLSAGVVEQITVHKDNRVHDIMADPNLAELPLVQAYHAGKAIVTKDHDYHLIDIDNLIKRITVSMPGDLTRRFNGYVVDDARNGDLNIDQVGVVHLPGISSKDVSLLDDEMTELRRPWHLIETGTLVKMLEGKTAEFSPAPAQIIRHMASFVAAIAPQPAVASSEPGRQPV